MMRAIPLQPKGRGKIYGVARDRFSNRGIDTVLILKKKEKTLFSVLEKGGNQFLRFLKNGALNFFCLFFQKRGPIIFVGF